jgi:sensor domain CHASE-containing protein
MTLSGPCLPHCYKCSTVTALLSQAALVYMIACVVYLIATTLLETPFKDSLTKEQQAIKKRVKYTRTQIFLLGICVGLLVVHQSKPFS